MSQFWSPVVHTLSPYTPGEQPKIEGLIKLNTNENPYPPSPQAVAAMKAELGTDGDRLKLYPDPTALILRQAIAEHFGVTGPPGIRGQQFGRSAGACVSRPAQA
jgi:histidinol-phosphate aminotransferase